MTGYRLYLGGSQVGTSPSTRYVFSGVTHDLLNGEEFDSLLEARVVVAEWVEQYNTLRPHRGLP